MSTPPAASRAPRKRDPERRRQKILDAAAAIVVERGPAALTHRAAAAKAGVALGSTTRHFPTIEDLREATLRILGDETDASLDIIEKELSTSDDPAGRCAELIHAFLLDRDLVHGTMALVTAGTSEATMRSLSLRWTDRLADILAQHVERERAEAAVVYLDGAVMHAALHEHPLDRETLARAVRALMSMSSTSTPPGEH